MAHAIIFVDRGPNTRDHEYTSQYYTVAAGAYKIASVLREMGLDVLVVPNCSNLTFTGIKQIIENNKQNLLWVGLSVTFFKVELSPEILVSYRKTWFESTDTFIDTDILCQKNANHFLDDLDLIWGQKEIGHIAQYLQSSCAVPFLVGGAGADRVSNFFLRHKNIHVVTGYSESYIKEFTMSRLTGLEPPVFVNNNNYDNTDYKISKIIWRPEDFVHPDDWLPLEVARGCAFNCGYCSYHRKATFDSYKSPKTLYDELLKNYELYGVTRYQIVDDLYNDSKEKVERLHDEVWRKLPFRPEWVSYMRLDMIWSDPDSARLIKDSGCRYVSFGIETLHDLAGKKVGKGLGKKRILETLEFLKHEWKKDTLITALLIAGLPYEPIESIKETMSWSTTTDLIHSPSWNPMYLSNTGASCNIESDFEKYGVSWTGPNEWINSAGVSKKMVANLCNGYADTLSSWGIRLSKSVYVDLRVAGFSHDLIANYKTVDLDQDQLHNATDKTKKMIQRRLNQILKTKF
jgi:hypothetical protein